MDTFPAHFSFAAVVQASIGQIWNFSRLHPRQPELQDSVLRHAALDILPRRHWTRPSHLFLASAIFKFPDPPQNPNSYIRYLASAAESKLECLLVISKRLIGLAFQGFKKRDSLANPNLLLRPSSIRRPKSDP
jgi:hypothetical protein